MPPTSALETVELAILSDTSNIRGEMTEAERVANQVVEKLSATFQVLKDEVSAARDNLVQSFEQMRLTSEQNLIDSELAFSAWASDFMNTYERSFVEAMSKITTGIGLGVDVAFKRLTNTLYNIPSFFVRISEAARDTFDYIFVMATKSKNVIAGMGLAIWHLGKPLVDATRKMFEFAKESSLVGTILRGIQGAANITMKVAGLTLAGAAIRSVWRGVKGEQESAFESLLNLVNQVLDPLSAALEGLIAEIAPQIISVLEPFIRMLAKTLDGLKDTFRESVFFGGELSKIFNILRNVVVEIAKLFGEIVQILVREVGPVLNEVLVTVFEELFKIVRVIVPMIANIIKVLVPAVASIIKELIPPLTEILQLAGEVIIEVLNVLQEEAGPLLGEFGDTMSGLMPLIGDLAKSLVQLIKALVPAITLMAKFVVHMASFLTKGFILVLEYSLKLITFLATKLAELIVIIQPYAIALTELLVEFAQKSMKAYEKYYDFVFSSFSGLIDFFAKIWTSGKKVLNLIGEAITSLAEKITAVYQKMFDFITKGVEQLNSVMTPILRYLPGFSAIGMASDLRDAVQNTRAGETNVTINSKDPAQIVVPVQEGIIRSVSSEAVRKGATSILLPDTLKTAKEEQILKENMKSTEMLRQIRDAIRDTAQDAALGPVLSTGVNLTLKGLKKE